MCSSLKNKTDKHKTQNPFNGQIFYAEFLGPFFEESGLFRNWIPGKANGQACLVRSSAFFL